jgi:hypothetical protein
MTAKELCEKYGVTEGTLKSNFSRVQKSILKKYGVNITKIGRGEKVSYQETESDCRAMTIFQEDKEKIFLDEQSLQLKNFNFLVLLAIVTTPMLVFRGSYKDFLAYVSKPATKDNINSLKEALDMLVEKEYISLTIDKTNSDYFVAALYRKVEEEMNVGIAMVQMCKKLAEDNGKKTWIPLLKTWLGIQVAAENQPFTMGQLMALTGLNDRQIRESRKILEQNDIFKTSKAYLSYNICLGTNVDLNGFYN